MCIRDSNYQAWAGLLALAGEHEGRRIVPALIADIAGGAHAAVINILLALRSQSPTENEESFTEYFSRSVESPFSSIEEMVGTPEFNEITRYARGRFESVPEASDHYNYLVARDRLMHNVMKVMADYELDAIVYKAVEHQPTLIEDGVNPPFVNTKGVPFINTFLVYVPAIVVPAGFTTDE